MEKLDGETGLYYYGARYLDPKYSRWISTDMSVRDCRARQSTRRRKNMRDDRIIMLLVAVFCVICSLLFRFALTGVIKRSDERTEENKRKWIKGAKVFSIYFLLVAIYWIFLAIFVE